MPADLSAARVAPFLCVAALATGCVHARDFRAPDERIIHGTAYTLEKNEARIDAGIVGTGLQELGLNLGVQGGVTKRLQLGANMAHFGLGIVNGQAKVNAVDMRRFGLSVQSGIAYARPQAIWILPKSLRDEFGPGHLIVVPTTLQTSYPLLDWLQLNLGAGYEYASAFGTFNPESLYVAGGLTQQEVYFRPRIDFFAAKRVAFSLAARLPAWTARQTAVAGEQEVSPGVVGGLVGVDWQRVPFADAMRYSLVIETRFGENTHLQVAAQYGGFFNKVGGWPVVPAVNLYWRLGGPQWRKERRAKREAKEQAGGEQPADAKSKGSDSP